MAMLISRATGNFTSSSTWGVADSATNSQLTNPSASTNTTTSYVYSSTFTGTNTKVADGIAVFLKRLTTTGTVSVALSDDNGVTATREVTVNASDLPEDESWVFFKFGTTLTLDGGTDYCVGVVASSADNALIYRNATAGNWARMVSTTDTASPAAGDTMLIVGEWTGAGASSSYTVTMDNTAGTDFGTNVTSRPQKTSPGVFSGLQIGQNGTLTWGTASATNYNLRLSGSLIVWSGGTYNMGTSGTPCPRDSTMTLWLDTTGSAITSTFFFSVFSGATINIVGQSRTAGKNIVSCLLTADAAANDTSISVSQDTGWLDNDRIAVASTTRTATESESGLLNGAAGASTLTVDGFAGSGGGLAFGHSGTSPTQAEVIVLTRNVLIRGGSTSNQAYIAFGTEATNPQIGASVQVYMRWVEFNWASIAGTLFLAPGSADIQYCSMWDVIGVFLMSATSNIALSNVTYANNVAFNFRSTINIIHSSAGSNNTFYNNIFMTNQNAGGCTLIGGTGVPGFAGSFYNNTFVGISGSISYQGSNAYTFYNNTVHSSSGIGMGFTGTPTLFDFPQITGCKSWRNSVGLYFGSALNSVVIENFIAFGNQTRNVQPNTNITGVIEIRNSTFAGDTSFSTPVGFSASTGTGAYMTKIKFVDCQFSPTSGIYVPHSSSDFELLTTAASFQEIELVNTLLGAATEVANFSFFASTGFIKSSKHDQTEGAFKSWFKGGVIERDTMIYNTAAPSERLTPISASIKLASGPRLVAVDDGGTITINVYVRKSVVGDGAAYNGNQPRLMVRANPVCGITAETVLDTMTAAAGSWEQLTGTTAAVDADGALEFYVDCDGTAGWINVDDWTVT